MEENKDFKAEEITKENQSAVEENELVQKIQKLLQKKKLKK